MCSLLNDSFDPQKNYGAISCPFTTLRDPLYYNFLARLVYVMQLHKFQQPEYTKKEVRNFQMEPYAKVIL